MSSQACKSAQLISTGGHDQPAISWRCMPLRPLCLLCFIRLFCTFLYVVCCYAQFAVHVQPIQFTRSCLTSLIFWDIARLACLSSLQPSSYAQLGPMAYHVLQVNIQDQHLKVAVWHLKHTKYCCWTLHPQSQKLSSCFQKWKQGTLMSDCLGGACRRWQRPVGSLSKNLLVQSQREDISWKLPDNWQDVSMEV